MMVAITLDNSGGIGTGERSALRSSVLTLGRSSSGTGTDLQSRPYFHEYLPSGDTDVGASV